MLEKITAPISRFVDALVAEGGHDLAFEATRLLPDRTPEGFISCSTRMGVGEMERGYQRLSSWLKLRGLRPSKKSSRVSRSIVINNN